VRVLDTPGEVDRNAIVVGSASGGLKPPTVLVVPRIDKKRIADEVGEMRFRSWRKRGHWAPL
jgi:hypothetical protein